MEQQCPLAGISFIFLPALVQKGQMSSNLPRDRMRFHQLGACKRECFHLAGIAISEGESRQELIESLAAGKYPTFCFFTSGTGNSGTADPGASSPGASSPGTASPTKQINLR